MPWSNRTSYKKFLTHAGETLSVAEWARRSVVGIEAFKHRIRAGMPLAEALTQPSRIHRDTARSNAARRAREAQKNAAIRQYKEARACKDCGRKYPHYVMDFDHVRGEKLFELSKMGDQTFVKIAAEIAKCDVVCANCHRLRTFSVGV